MRLASVLMGWCLSLMRRWARQLKVLTALASEGRRLGRETSVVEYFFDSLGIAGIS